MFLPKTVKEFRWLRKVYKYFSPSPKSTKLQFTLSLNRFQTQRLLVFNGILQMTLKIFRLLILVAFICICICPFLSPPDVVSHIIDVRLEFAWSCRRLLCHVDGKLPQTDHSYTDQVKSLIWTFFVENVI